MNEVYVCLYSYIEELKRRTFYHLVLRKYYEKGQRQEKAVAKAGGDPFRVRHWFRYGPLLI